MKRCSCSRFIRMKSRNHKYMPTHIPKQVRAALDIVLTAAMTGVYETSGDFENDERTEAVRIVRGWLIMVDKDNG